MRIKLTVSYDGTEFCGWQVQNNGISVQQTLEQALKEVTGESARVTGSGRTDAGVHALGQVAHFDTASSVPPQKFYKALNAHLPLSVKVLSSERAADDFHACKQAKKKTYRYSVYLADTELPLKERYAFRAYGDLHIESMQKAANALVGEHDFKAFSSTGGSVKTSVRTIYYLNVERTENDITFTVCGNGFLYNMVRIIAGTLIKAGRGEIDDKTITEMLETGNRTLGGETLPAKGLCLLSVEY